MRFHLIVLLLVIMGAGACSMFEIAYQGMALEHGASPNPETYFYIFVALWYVLMMVADILLLAHKNLKFRNAIIVAFTIGVAGPIIYMLINSK